MTNQSTSRMNAPRTQCVQLGAFRFRRIHGYSAVHAAQNAADPATFGDTPNLRTTQLALKTPAPATPAAVAKRVRFSHP